jgi:succinate-acetate transporter protein
VLLTVATMRLPFAFTLLFGLIALALLLVLLATANASTSLQTAAGYVVLAFALVGVYLFMSAASAATGGKAYPLGNPLMH